MGGICPGQNGHTDRHAYCCPEQKRPEPPPVERVTELPDGVALHDKAEWDDQRCLLQGVEGGERDRSRDEAERKAGKDSDKPAADSLDKKDRKMRGGPSHVPSPTE